MWSRKHGNASSGFTLIELLVTSALALVLVGGSLFAFNSYQVRQTQSVTAKQVIAVLNEARNRSTSGDKPSDDCSSLVGYRVRAIENTDRYFLSVVCSGSSELEVQQFTLSEGYIFLNSSFDITFPYQPGPVSDDDVNVDIGKNLPDTAEAFRFVIYASGIIEEQGTVSL